VCDGSRSHSVCGVVVLAGNAVGGELPATVFVCVTGWMDEWMDTDFVRYGSGGTLELDHRPENMDMVQP